MEIWEENQIPEMIQKSIQELIKRAEKIKKPHVYHMLSFWMFSLLATSMLTDACIYFWGISEQMWQAVIFYLTNQVRLTLLVLLSFLFFCYQYFKTEEKKKESKFECLREEIIESIRTEWPIYLTKKQIIKIIEFLKKEYQINLYYKG